MSRTAYGFTLGFALGAASVILYRRLRQILEGSDPDVLVERLHTQVESLEKRFAPPASQ